jgi:hypothetical protein
MQAENAAAEIFFINSKENDLFFVGIISFSLVEALNKERAYHPVPSGPSRNHPAQHYIPASPSGYVYIQPKRACAVCCHHAPSCAFLRDMQCWEFLDYDGRFWSRVEHAHTGSEL